MLFLRARPKARILMVCMGNVCRSPMAQLVLAHRLGEAGLSRSVQVDSAGTHAMRGGESPDPRARAALQARGYPATRGKPRQIGDTDFSGFDLVLAMDRGNLSALRELCPGEFSFKLRLLREFAPDTDELDVPDPYYGPAKGFDHVLDLIEPAIQGLIAQHRQAWA